jgi:hypothetical protein
VTAFLIYLQCWWLRFAVRILGTDNWAQHYQALESETRRIL